jgi:hypothetical protein
MGVAASLCIAAGAVAELCLKTAPTFLPTKSRAVANPLGRLVGISYSCLPSEQIQVATACQISE